MDIFSNNKIKNNSINRIVESQDNKLDAVMRGNEKTATLGTLSKVFNYYLNRAKNDKLPELLAWFFLKRQMADEGFNYDKFENIVFSNFIDKDKYTWNQMSLDEKKSWMQSHDISGIDLNYKFPGVNTPQGNSGYYFYDPKSGSSARYLNPSTSKEPYNFGSYGMKPVKQNMEEKEKFLKDTNYFGFGEAGKQYWEKLKLSGPDSLPEPKFKKR
jgi:hypothetical protein